MGSIVGLLRKIVEDLRRKGYDIGLIKIRTFRPFPVEELKKSLNDAEKIIVVDRSLSLGYEGNLSIELKSALYGFSAEIISLILGLGGRDIPKEFLEKLLEDAILGKESSGFKGVKEFEEVIP